MIKRMLFLAGAATLVMASAYAEPPHNGTHCPPGQKHCANSPQQPAGKQAPQSKPAPQKNAGPMGKPGPMGNPVVQPNAPVKGPVWHGGPGSQKNAGGWHWQDDRGGWHRDRDRYWRPEFRGGFAPRERIFLELRRHRFIRFNGDPYWFQGRFVIRSFDRNGRPVFVEINPYTGAFIGVIRF